MNHVECDTPAVVLPAIHAKKSTIERIENITRVHVHFCIDRSNTTGAVESGSEQVD